MVVTGSLSLLPKTFNGASDALERDADGEKVERLTNREDIPFPTDHLIRLCRNEKILPYIYRAARINSREGPKKVGMTNLWRCGAPQIPCKRTHRVQNKEYRIAVKGPGGGIALQEDRPENDNESLGENESFSVWKRRRRDGRIYIAFDAQLVFQRTTHLAHVSLKLPSGATPTITHASKHDKGIRQCRW